MRNFRLLLALAGVALIVYGKFVTVEPHGGLLHEHALYYFLTGAAAFYAGVIGLKGNVK